MHNCRLRICVISQLLLAPQLSLIFFLACLIKKKKKDTNYKETNKQKKTTTKTTNDITNRFLWVYFSAYI